MSEQSVINNGNKNVKCLQHPSENAIGVCAHCGQFACQECVNNATSGSNLCSERCGESISRQTLLQELQLEYFRVIFRSYRGLAIAFKLISGVCLIAAVGDLLASFVLVRYIPELEALDRVSACGFAGIMVLLAAICFFCAKVIVPYSEKLDDQLSRLD